MPFAGIMCDLLWSDPQMLVCISLVIHYIKRYTCTSVCVLVATKTTLPLSHVQNGRSPSKRGVGTQFGPNVTEDFLSRNGLGEESQCWQLVFENGRSLCTFELHVI